MTAPESTWRTVPASEVREGQRVRLHRGEGHEAFVVEGVAWKCKITGSAVVGRLMFSGYAANSEATTRVEVATPPLPTEPGTVIDATVAGLSVRLLLADSESARLKWVYTTGTYSNWCSTDDISDWTLVATAPSKPDSGTMIIDRPAATDPVALEALRAKLMATPDEDEFVVGALYLFTAPDIGATFRCYRGDGQWMWHDGRACGWTTDRWREDGYSIGTVPVPAECLPPAPGGENA